jgi:hypothetical protein
MANRPIPDNLYDALTEAFRRNPGNITQAAEIVGVSRATARRAWAVGYPRVNRPAIQRVITDEQIAARASMADEHARQAALDLEDRRRTQRENSRKAREDLARTRKQEAELVRAQRGNVAALVGITGHALRGMIEQARILEGELRAGKDSSNGQVLSLPQRMRAMDTLARIVQRASEAAAEVVRMERLLLGEPTEIVGTTATLEEVVREFEATSRAVQRVKHGLVALPGGRASDGGASSAS